MRIKECFTKALQGRTTRSQNEETEPPKWRPICHVNGVTNFTEIINDYGAQ